MARPFSWSYSKMKNYLACPFRHQQVDLLKNYTDQSAALTWGNEVHDSLARACGPNREPLPATMGEYVPWVVKYASPGIPGELKIEQQLAITKDFQPTTWFGANAWLRVKVDLLRIHAPVGLSVDWKTGKLQHDSRQLMISTQCVFAHYPEIHRVKTEFAWLKDDAVTPEYFSRKTIVNEWPPVLDIVKQMEHAYNTGTYPPKPGPFCREWCPVKSCEHNGKFQRR